MKTDLHTKKSQPEIDVSQKVLDKINKKKIKITDRWVFWARKLGLESGLVLTAIILVVLINLILYFMQLNGLMIYLTFGLPSLVLIFRNLPFGYIILAIIAFLIINLLLKKSGFIYKKHFRTIALIILLIIVISGIFIFYSGINETLANRVAQSDQKIFILSEIYKGHLPCLPADRNGVIGKVIEKNINNVTVLTLDNQKEIIISGEQKLFTNIMLGQIVGAIGTGGENIFVADKLKTITQELVDQCINSDK